MPRDGGPPRGLDRARASLASVAPAAAAVAALAVGAGGGTSPGAHVPSHGAAPLAAPASAAPRDAGAVPQRIVSLVPAATELLFAIGAGDRLVGRTHWGVHPRAARAVPDLGDAIRPSLERIVARRPDLVVLYDGAGTAGTIERLEGLGIRTLPLRHDTLEDLLRNIARLGETVGCRSSAHRLRRRIVRDLGEIAARTGGLERPSVYYDVWDDPPITIGRGSYLDTLLHIAGGRNLFHDVGDPSPQVSLEAIAARDPDLVLFPTSDSEEGSRRAPRERTGWRVVRAVAEGRVRRVDGDLVHRLGPRVADAAGELARAIHRRAAVLDGVAGAGAAPRFETGVGACAP